MSWWLKQFLADEGQYIDSKSRAYRRKSAIPKPNAVEMPYKSHVY